MSEEKHFYIGGRGSGGGGGGGEQPRLDMPIRQSREDLDKAERKRDRRNDLAKEAMKITIELRSGWVGSGKYKEAAIDAYAYAYADAMLTASGDYDES